MNKKVIDNHESDGTIKKVKKKKSKSSVKGFFQHNAVEFMKFTSQQCGK